MKKILIVEDDRELKEGICYALQKAGYLTESADSVQNAKTLFLKDAAVILQALLPIGAGLLLMYAIQALCKYYVTCQGHMMGAHMERDMRQQLFDHYEK